MGDEPGSGLLQKKKVKEIEKRLSIQRILLMIDCEFQRTRWRKLRNWGVVGKGFKIGDMKSLEWVSGREMKGYLGVWDFLW